MNSVSITEQAMGIMKTFGGKILVLLALALVLEFLINKVFSGNDKKLLRRILSIVAPLCLAVFLLLSEVSFIGETFNLLKVFTDSIA